MAYTEKDSMASLSVVLATYNEENNLPDCLRSVQAIADEIVIVDGKSSDKTVEIAESFGAKVHITQNHPIFHINKQKAIDLAKHEWILQLDADEWVSDALAAEIKKIISMSDEEIDQYQQKLQNRTLFLRHQRLLEKRDGEVGTATGRYGAFFVPRKNYFLGRYLRYGGVYPDGVIRLLRKGKAYLPAKDVHEQMVVEGKVGWLQNDLFHMDSPTFGKYFKRWSRYTDLIAEDYRKHRVGRNPLVGIQYMIIRPIWWFFLTYFRHKGFMDGWQGFVFSFFSALRYPVSYSKLIKKH